MISIKTPEEIKIMAEAGLFSNPASRAIIFYSFLKNDIH